MAPGKVGGILANDRYPVEFPMNNLTITQRTGGTYLRKFESSDTDPEGCASQNARVNDS